MTYKKEIIMNKQLSFDEATKFVANEKDYARWNKQMKSIYDVLADGNWHSREELEKASGAKQPTARVSELRKQGYIIDCQRVSDIGATVYKILSYVGYDTTKTKHCYCCRYNENFKETYTG